MKKLDKVYIVIGHDGPEFGEQQWVEKVFDGKEKAEKYTQLKNEIEDYYGFYVKEEKVETEIDMNAKVAEYYSYLINKDDEDEDFDDYNDEETEKRIYKEDLIIIDNEEYIQVFSTESFEKARMEALKLYENYKLS